MGCEGQFEQPADGVQNRHVTFLPLSLSNRTLKGKKKKPLSPRKQNSCSKLFDILSGSGMDLCIVNCSLILNKEVTVGGTWHTLLAPQAGLRVMAGCFV